MKRPRFMLLKRPKIIHDVRRTLLRRPISTPTLFKVLLATGVNFENSKAILITELEPFDFINQFPAEVRNMIYRWTWILSRKRPEDEGIPDFYVKPDLEYRNSRLPPKIATVRWENIHGFPLLRLNQQLRSEVLPIIAKETHFELRVYQQEYDKDLSFFGGHIEKVPLLRDAGKITIHQTDIDGSYVWWINLLIEQIACNKRLKILIVSHTIFITTKYEFDQIPRDFQEVCRLLREIPDLDLRVHLRRGPVIWLRLDEDDEDADVEVSGGYILPIMMEEIEKWFIQLAATLGVSDEKIQFVWSILSPTEWDDLHLGYPQPNMILY